MLDLNKDNKNKNYSIKTSNQYRTKHTKNELLEKVFEQHGVCCKIDIMNSDGNCGWSSYNLILESWGKELMKISDLRKAVYKYGSENVDKFVGTTEDGSDSCFKRQLGGSIGYSCFGTRQAVKNKQEQRARIFKKTILNGIFHSGRNYMTNHDGDPYIWIIG